MYVALFLLTNAILLVSSADGTVPALDCSESPIISLNTSKLEELGVIEGDEVIIWPRRVYLADDLPEECVQSFDGGTDSVVFNINVTDCEPDIEEDDYFINVTYTIRNQPYKDLSEPVQRYEDNCWLLTCYFYKKENLTAGAIIPEIRKTELDEVVEDAEFEFEMNFYENCSFEEELDPLEVFVPDYVNVKIDLVDLYDDDFVLQIKQCYATLYEDDNDPKYDLIVDGCPADEYVQVVRNYEPLYGGFKFQSFVWTNVMDDAQEIFVHCEVVVCHNATDDQCQDPGDCEMRRRRDIIGSKRDEDRRLVTSQRLRVLQSEPDSCLKNNGGCSDKCLIDGDEVVCDCFGRRQMGNDGKTCFYLEHPRINIHESSSVETTENLSVMAFAALALLTIIAGCAIFLNIYNRARVVKI